jgi:hypothetical protein
MNTTGSLKDIMEKNNLTIEEVIKKLNLCIVKK